MCLRACTMEWFLLFICVCACVLPFDLQWGSSVALRESSWTSSPPSSCLSSFLHTRTHACTCNHSSLTVCESFQHTLRFLHDSIQMLNSRNPSRWRHSSLYPTQFIHCFRFFVSGPLLNVIGEIPAHTHTHWCIHGGPVLCSKTDPLKERGRWRRRRRERIRSDGSLNVNRTLRLSFFIYIASFLRWLNCNLFFTLCLILYLHLYHTTPPAPPSSPLRFSFCVTQ